MDKDMALDVSNKSGNKNCLILWKKHGKKNQVFKIMSQNGKYVIFSSQGGTVEVPQGSTNNETKIVVSQPNNAQN